MRWACYQREKNRRRKWLASKQKEVDRAINQFVSNLDINYAVDVAAWLCTLCELELEYVVFPFEGVCKDLEKAGYSRNGSYQTMMGGDQEVIANLEEFGRWAIGQALPYLNGNYSGSELSFALTNVYQFLKFVEEVDHIKIFRD